MAEVSPHVVFITDEYGPGSIERSVREQIEFDGLETEDIVIGHALIQTSAIAPHADLHVLRSRSLAGFSAAAAFSVAGARLLVPIERERVVRNRFLVRQALTDAGIRAALDVERATAHIELYGVGSRVFAAGPTPTAEMIDIAERCRQALGLELYSIKLLETERGLLVVHVDSTPCYNGIDAAAEPIAELICERALDVEKQ